MSEARALATSAPNVTITVQITVSGETLPVAAHRLVTDLRELVSAGHGAPQSEVRVLPEPRALPPAPLRESTTLRLVAPPRQSPDRVPLRIETGSRTVHCDGAAVHLARREYDLLAFLCQYPRRVFSRGQLLRQVWGYEMVGGERTVDVHVRRLRAKLGRCADGIVTVRGVGYRFDDEGGIELDVARD